MSIFEKIKEAIPDALVDDIVGHPIAEKIGGFFGSIAGHIIAGLVILAFTAALSWFAYHELPGRIKARLIKKAGAIERSKWSGDEDDLIKAINTCHEALEASVKSENDHLTNLLRTEIQEAESLIREKHWTGRSD